MIIPIQQVTSVMCESDHQAVPAFAGSFTLYATMRSYLCIPILFVTLSYIGINGPESDWPLFQSRQNRSVFANESSCGFTDASFANITIDSLKVGEKYLINVESNGCFHHSDLVLMISRQKRGYCATFKMKGKIHGVKRKQNLKKSWLNRFQIDSLRKFEQQLTFVSSKKYECTTVHEYHLAIGSHQRTLTVDDCEWEGITKLVSYLFEERTSGVPHRIVNSGRQ